MLKNTNTSIFQDVFKYILGAFMIFAGIGHLTFNRLEFQAQVPNWLPFSKDFVVLASGCIEIALGLGMLFWKNNRTKVWHCFLCLFSLAIFHNILIILMLLVC
jgi:uncharacterized membrane protein